VSNEAVADKPLPPKSYGVELMVGIFAIIGTLAFGYLAINIAGIRVFRSGVYPVQVEFENISGLKMGAPVEIAGVPVGEVADISLHDTSAIVTMEIKNGVVIRSDDILAIRTKGIIGDRYIKLIPGSSDAMVRSGGGRQLVTESAVEFEDIIGKLIHRMDGSSSS
jgi:phospholipid/cholesterol/gamma-HCH transport system substrate-binding protein